MKRIILLVMILVLLPGCGIFNLNYFVMPDDIEFLTLVDILDTPEKISDYMVDNFVYKRNYITAVNPYELWQIGKGDCNDFSTFGTFIADYHGYETYQIEIKLKNTLYAHYIAVYNEGRYSFTDNQYYFYGYNTFREVVEKSCQDNICYEWTKYKVYDYENNIIERRINN